MRSLHVISLVCCAALLTPARSADPAAGKQVEQVLKLGEKSISFLLFLPKEYGATETKWPLMLFLHGRGESDGPLSLVKRWGPPRLVERGENFPFVLVSPQCPPRPESWGLPSQQELLVALLDHVAKEYKIHTDRVYLTGLSMGGFGTWRLAADHPERFAAAVPICGGGKPEDASNLKNLPLWVFHGTDDKSVPLQRSIDMVEAIKAAGNTSIRFTTLEHIGHNSWEAAYAAPELYQWLEKQSASRNLPQKAGHN